MWSWAWLQAGKITVGIQAKILISRCSERESSAFLFLLSGELSCQSKPVGQMNKWMRMETIRMENNYLKWHHMWVNVYLPFPLVHLKSLGGYKTYASTHHQRNDKDILASFLRSLHLIRPHLISENQRVISKGHRSIWENPINSVTGCFLWKIRNTEAAEGLRLQTKTFS